MKILLLGSSTAIWKLNSTTRPVALSASATRGLSQMIVKSVCCNNIWRRTAVPKITKTAHILLIKNPSKLLWLGWVDEWGRWGWTNEGRFGDKNFHASRWRWQYSKARTRRLTPRPYRMRPMGVDGSASAVGSVQLPDWRRNGSRMERPPWWDRFCEMRNLELLVKVHVRLRFWWPSAIF